MKKPWSGERPHPKVVVYVGTTGDSSYFRSSDSDIAQEVWKKCGPVYLSGVGISGEMRVRLQAT